MSIQARFHFTHGDFSLDVDLNMASQGITAIAGPSGCGKTSLLRAIAGLDRHPDGYLRFNNTSWQDENHFLAAHQRPLGYVFQEASLFPHLDVKQNLVFGLKRTAGVEQKIALHDAIELLGISHLLERKTQHLSGGERQRVAIARALAVSPQILLMDEPLAALDHERKKEVLPYLESLHQSLDIPVLYVSHAHDEIARLADQLVLMQEGRVIDSGDIHTLMTRFDLPLAHEHDAETIIEATVTGHDDEYHLTYLAFAGGHLTVTGNHIAIGENARLRIAARDVSLTLARQADTSILNIFPATVEAISEEGDAQVTVRLRVEEHPLLARITRKSADLLALEPGKQVYAQAKSVALLA